MNDENALVRLSEATRMLEAATTLPDIKAVHDLAAAMQEYARTARLGKDAQNEAGVVRLEAEAKGGQVLIDMAVRGERARPGERYRAYLLGQEACPTLADLGLDVNQSQVWRGLARVPETTRREYYEAVRTATVDDDTVTRWGLLRFAGLPVPTRRKVAPEPEPEPDEDDEELEDDEDTYYEPAAPVARYQAPTAPVQVRPATPPVPVVPRPVLEPAPVPRAPDYDALVERALRDLGRALQAQRSGEWTPAPRLRGYTRLMAGVLNSLADDLEASPDLFAQIGAFLASTNEEVEK